MKKALLILAFLFTFVLGIAVSEWVLHGINQLFTKDVFTTKTQLNKEAEDIRKRMKESEKDLNDYKAKYKELSDQMTKNQANLNSLIKEIDTKVNAGIIKDILLKTPSTHTGEKGMIFLDAKGSESILEPTTTDDPTVTQFKQSFNQKAKDIIDIAKSVLKKKVGQYNSELVRVNEELESRNLELIGKLKEVEKFRKELEQKQKYIHDLENVKDHLQKTVGVLETKIENGRLKVSFKGDILFESGEHHLRKEGKILLDSVYPILFQNINQNDIFIAGHTDNVPIRPDAQDRYESNWTLSTYRATEVVKYLVKKGIAPQSLTAAGYGEYKPIADNSTEIGKSKNRRVELFLIPKIIKRSVK